jgi:SAM-dependent methyltransferase
MSDDSLARLSADPIWPTAEQFVMSLPPRSLLLGLGDVSGRYTCLNRHILHIGANFSMQQCRTDSVCASALDLPFVSASFDHVLCLHMIHHLRTRAQRLRCLVEICRVLRIGGSAFVTAKSATVESTVECDDCFREGEFFRLAHRLPDLECLEEVVIGARMEAAFLRIG